MGILRHVDVPVHGIKKTLLKMDLWLNIIRVDYKQTNYEKGRENLSICACVHTYIHILLREIGVVDVQITGL